MARRNGGWKMAAAALLLALPFWGAAKAERVVACAGVENREPSGAADRFAAAGEVWCFSELSDAADTSSITHVWLKDGREVFRQTLAVKAAHWRTWSRKRVSAGAWKVSVQDPSGAEIGSVQFTVGP